MLVLDWLLGLYKVFNEGLQFVAEGFDKAVTWLELAAASILEFIPELLLQSALDGVVSSSDDGSIPFIFFLAHVPLEEGDEEEEDEADGDIAGGDQPADFCLFGEDGR